MNVQNGFSEIEFHLKTFEPETEWSSVYYHHAITRRLARKDVTYNVNGKKLFT